jgi:tetratricopeptide (TPR) repeat protein
LEAIENLRGATDIRKSTAQRAVEQLQLVERENPNDPLIQRDVGAAYLRLADVLGRPGFSNLGDAAGAQAYYAKALEILKPVAAANAQNLETNRQLAQAYVRQADLWLTDGQPRQAMTLYQTALPIAKRLLDLSTGNRTQPRIDVATILVKMANLRANSGNVDEAIDYARQAEPLFRQAMTAERPSPEVERQFALAQLATGFILAQRLNDKEQGLRYYREARPILERRAEQNPDNVQATRERGVMWNFLGLALIETGQFKEAFGVISKELAADERVRDADPNNQQATDDVAVTYGSLARVLWEMGSRDVAEGYYRKAYDLRAAVVKRVGDAPNPKSRLALTLDDLGNTALRRGHDAEALAHYRQALEIRERLSAANNKNTSTRRDLGVSYFHVAEAGRELELPVALRQAQLGLQVFEELAGDRDNVQAQKDLGDGLTTLGKLHAQTGAVKDADQELARAATTLADLSKKDSKHLDVDLQDLVATAALERGRVSVRLGRGDALPELTQAVTIRETLARKMPESQERQENLVEAYVEISAYLSKNNKCAEALSYVQRGRGSVESVRNKHSLDIPEVRMNQQLAGINAACAKSRCCR